MERNSAAWTARGVERSSRGMPTSDGAGVRLTRVLGHSLQRRLDPFLMLDAFRSDRPGDYMAGFPEHPHRGFETITYMIAGRMRHRDSGGNEGLVENGGAQWMRAARGVLHSEMPEQEEGLMEGFQLWLNLPAAEKMGPAGYEDIPASRIPSAALPGGGRVKVVAGESQGLVGPGRSASTRPLLLDVELRAGERFEQPIEAGHNAFAYVFGGSARFEGGKAPGGVEVFDGQLAILESGEGLGGVRIEAGAQGAKVLLVAGAPIGEPIAQMGPFVMNTQAELVEAVEQFRAGTFLRGGKTQAAAGEAA